MFLKKISITELNFEKSWINGIKKLKDLSSFDKCMTIFWFLGPLIYLIERDPADLWLSIIALIFIIRSTIKKDWSWTKQWWVIFSLCFWLTSLFSSVFSPDPLFSFQQGFVWIRFPLYAAAAQVWLARDRDIRIMMLIFIGLGMILMCFILFAEIMIEPKPRLMWPYGDMVPGGYLSKVSLPLFCILMAITASKSKKVSFFFGLISIASIYFIIMTGERINFLIRFCSGILAGFSWRPKIFLIVALLFMQLLLITVLILPDKNIYYRFVDSVQSHIHTNTSDSNPYWGAWRSGIQQGLEKPLIGIGPSGTRNTCANLLEKTPAWLPGKNYCGNHPHNFYIQMFAETGIIGLIFGTCMFFSIIFACYKIKAKNECPMASTAFIIPFALFFPLQQFGSFFGQWGNLFIWFAIGFSVAQIQNWDKKLKP